MPAVALPAYVPYLSAVAIGWMVYRRVRRNFGRQPWQPRRMLLRMVLQALVLLLLLGLGAWAPATLVGTLPGMLVGMGLGIYTLRHTRVALMDGKPSYLPNPWVGGVLTAALLGRLAWRWQQGAFAATPATGTLAPSALTFAFVALLLGYFLAHNLGLYRRLRQLGGARS